MPSIEQLQEKYQEEICELCSDTYYNGNVNSAPHNLCEGSMCSRAWENFYESNLLLQSENAGIIGNIGIGDGLELYLQTFK